MVAGAVGVGAVNELAYDVNVTRHRGDAVVAVVADVHVALAVRAVAVLPDQFEPPELDAVGQAVGHGGNLLLVTVIGSPRPQP